MKLTKKLAKDLLKENKTSDQIIVILGAKQIFINDREWRRMVRQFNDEFAKSGLYIASNRNGYILTTKSEVIKRSAFAKFHTGLSMIKNAKATLKELTDKNQLSFIDKEDLDIYRAICSFKEN